MRAEFLPFIVFLLAVAACGGDNTTTDLTPPDTTAPSVTLTEPGPVTLSGSVTLSASATDDQGVAKVRFRVDEQDAAPEITSPPYVVVWNSRLVPDGTHFIDAVATDQTGNSRASAPVRVKVNNGPPLVEALERSRRVIGLPEPKRE
jgi:hypothetical protein